MKYAINGMGIPEATGPYAQGTTAGRLVFASGQVAYDPDDPSKLVGRTVAEQTARTIDVIESILAEVDCSLSDVAQMTVYLTDIDAMDEMNEVYAQRFLQPAPARAVVAVSALPMGALVEMDCVACR